MKQRNKGEKVRINFINKAINFLKESKAELSRVVWPSKKEVFRDTTLVIASILIATAIVAAFDITLIKLVQIFVIK